VALSEMLFSETNSKFVMYMVILVFPEKTVSFWADFSGNTKMTMYITNFELVSEKSISLKLFLIFG
jgi:hypothetical protein